jgi:predicted DNA-binding protein
MTLRQKRSISLPPELDEALETAAAEWGMSVSAWIAETVQRRLRIEAGLTAVADWEAEHGALTPAELAEGRERLRAALADARSNR